MKYARNDTAAPGMPRGTLLERMMDHENDRELTKLEEEIIREFIEAIPTAAYKRIEEHIEKQRYNRDPGPHLWYATGKTYEHREALKKAGGTWQRPSALKAPAWCFDAKPTIVIEGVDFVEQGS